jgi:hypothetical protein
MKRYLLFAGDDYYPQKAWYEFRGSFDTIEEAKGISNYYAKYFDWWQIVDTETEEVIFDNE